MKLKILTLLLSILSLSITASLKIACRRLNMSTLTGCHKKTPYYLHNKGFKMYPEPESNRQGKNPTGF
jgi:hypothetical protein